MQEKFEDNYNFTHTDDILESVFKIESTLFGTKRIIVNRTKNISENKFLQDLQTQKNKLYNAMHSGVIKLVVPYKIKKIQFNDKKYTLKSLNKDVFIFTDIFHVRKVKREICKLIFKIEKAIKKTELELQNERITQAIESLSEDQWINTKKFYSKANYDKASAPKSQITKILIKDKNDKIVKNITSGKQTKEYIANFFQQIYNSCRKSNNENKPWFTTPSFTKNHKVIYQKDGILTETITKEEILAICTSSFK